MYCKVIEYIGILDCEKLHKHLPEPIRKIKGATLLWDLVIQNDRTIKSNRPDIVPEENENMPSNWYGRANR